VNWLQPFIRLFRRPQDGSIAAFEAKSDDHDAAIEEIRKHQAAQERRMRSIEASRDVLRRRFPS